ncbi:hypothetical protein [Caballeronia sp. KNU42]
MSESDRAALSGILHAFKSRLRSNHFPISQVFDSFATVGDGFATGTKPAHTDRLPELLLMSDSSGVTPAGIRRGKHFVNSRCVDEFGA